MSEPLHVYLEVVVAALATLTVACASFAAAYVVKVINSWRKWGGK